MSLPKNKFRELVFQMLYRHHFQEPSEECDEGFYMAALKTTKKNVRLANAYVAEILTKLPEINEHIKNACSNYDLERIQSVEVNVLRLSLYEILYEKDIPEKVSIAEGIRLAKKFSAKDAIAFVNGILDQVYKNKSNPVYTV